MRRLTDAPFYRFGFKLGFGLTGNKPTSRTGFVIRKIDAHALHEKLEHVGLLLALELELLVGGAHLQHIAHDDTNHQVEIHRPVGDSQGSSSAPRARPVSSRQ
jgi:hypothetical protein